MLKPGNIWGSGWNLTHFPKCNFWRTSQVKAQSQQKEKKLNSKRVKQEMIPSFAHIQPKILFLVFYSSRVASLRKKGSLLFPGVCNFSSGAVLQSEPPE